MFLEELKVTHSLSTEEILHPLFNMKGHYCHVGLHEDGDGNVRKVLTYNTAKL
jgi:hypothetical protein